LLYLAANADHQLANAPAGLPDQQRILGRLDRAGAVDTALQCLAFKSNHFQVADGSLRVLLLPIANNEESSHKQSQDDKHSQYSPARFLGAFVPSFSCHRYLQGENCSNYTI